MNLESQSNDMDITARFKRSIQVERFLLPLLTTTLVLMAACASAAPPTPGSTLSAETILEQARRAMDAVQSYRVYIDTAVSNYDDGELARVATGQWAAPNEYQLLIEIYGADDASIREIISAGNRTLIIQSNGFQHEVEESEDSGPQVFSPPMFSFETPIIPDLIQVALRGESQVDGVDVYHITGLPSPSENSEPPVLVIGYDLYIAKDDMRLIRLQTNAEVSIPTSEVKFLQTTVYTYFDHNEPVEIVLPPADPCNRSKRPGSGVDCDRLSQRVYWLDERLDIPGSPSLELGGAWISYRNVDDEITENSRLTVTYSDSETTGGRGSIELRQWSRPGWKQHTVPFTGYDPATVPPNGPVNWWQHPCVEEEVYNQANGAEIHLFQAHLPSLIYIYPMSDEESSQCLTEPVGAVGAHVYFDETVVEFSVQDSVIPAGPPAAPQVLVPGATPRSEAPQPYPELVIVSRNPYNDVDIVRLIAASLKTYEKP